MLQLGVLLREVHPLDTLQLRRLLLALGHVDEDGRPLRLARGPRIAAAAGRLRALLRRGRCLRRRRSAQLDERLGRSGEGRHAAPPQRCDSTMISFSPRMASSASEQQQDVDEDDHEREVDVRRSGGREDEHHAGEQELAQDVHDLE